MSDAKWVPLKAGDVLFTRDIDDPTPAWQLWGADGASLTLEVRFQWTRPDGEGWRLIGEDGVS